MKIWRRTESEGATDVQHGHVLFCHVDLAARTPFYTAHTPFLTMILTYALTSVCLT